MPTVIVSEFVLVAPGVDIPGTGHVVREQDIYEDGRRIGRVVEMERRTIGETAYRGFGHRPDTILRPVEYAITYV